MPQRQHRIVDNNHYNTVGLFTDEDTGGELVLAGFDFARKWNPLEFEWYDQIIAGGTNTKKWDNIHQTFAGVVDPERSVGFYDHAVVNDGGSYPKELLNCKKILKN